MKLFLVAFIFAFVTLSFNVGASNSHINEYKCQQGSQQTVYICKGPKSLKFHSSSSCSGLRSCSTAIYPVSISEAKNLGRTACQICY